MMKGKTLVELAQAVQDQASRKVDFVADTRNIEFKIESDSNGKFSPAALHITADRADAKGLEAVATLTPHAISQIAEHTGIPAKYAGRMLTEAPKLMEQNVNYWFRANPALRMVRTLREPGMQARAFLSNRYHRMENDQLLATVLPEILGADNGFKVLTTELSDTKMYLKVIAPKLEGEVRKGDLVQYGFTLSNSEIGMGAFAVTPFVYRLVCLNGLTLPVGIDDARMRKAHLGRALEIGAEFFTDETIRAGDKALQLQLRDAMRAFQDQSRWNTVLTKLRATTEGGEAADPIAMVERVAETFALPKPEQNSVLTNFLKGGDLSRWGLLNAVTAVANDAESFDRSQELEQIGGRILDLPASDWTRLAKAA